MSTAEELLALADRIEALPTYSGDDLRASVHRLDRPESTATRDVEVILISAEWRQALASALRAMPK